MKQFKAYGDVRKLCTLLMLIMLLQIPAMAEEVSPSVEYGTTGNSITSTFTGTIPVAMIAVELPGSIAFEVNPDLPLESNGYNQVKPGTGSYSIKNDGSTVELTIVGLTDPRYEANLTGGEKAETVPFTYFGTMADVVELVSTPATIYGRKTGAMVSLWLTGDAYQPPSSNADLEGKAITPAKFDQGGSIVIGTIPRGETAVLQVYCYAKTNFTGRSFEFSLTPILKVELEA